MAVKHRIVRDQSLQHDELRRRLKDEWQHPHSGDEEPIIVEEKGSTYQTVHLYDIWSDWPDLTLQERSEIIMEAFEDLRGRDEVLNVTVAMGLTPGEARRMGIRYE